jgi:hypothetical protein
MTIRIDTLQKGRADYACLQKDFAQAIPLWCGFDGGYLMLACERSGDSGGRLDIRSWGPEHHR